MRCLWLVSGGMEAIPGVKKAKELGLHVVVSDGNPKAPAFSFADDSFVVSTYDIERTVNLALDYHHKVRRIDGVLSVGADVPLTVASIADKLGLPGISLATARLSSDKLEMKRCFERSKIPIPWYSPVESFEHLKRLVDDTDDTLILKPVDSRGARGVLKLCKDTDLEWAYNHSLSFSPTNRIMVEEFLYGSQISTESIIINGKVVTPGFSDRNYEFIDKFSPFIIENGGDQPSKLSDNNVDLVKRVAERAALAMGIVNGTAKGDIVLTDEGPKVIEMAARLSGGWFCSDQIPLATGVDFIGIAIRLALGDKVRLDDITHKFSRGVSQRYLFTSPGKVVSINNVDEAKSLPGIQKVEIFVEEGDIVLPVTDHTKRTGMVIAVGENREEAIERAVKAVNMIEIKTV